VRDLFSRSGMVRVELLGRFCGLVTIRPLSLLHLLLHYSGVLRLFSQSRRSRYGMRELCSFTVVVQCLSLVARFERTCHHLRRRSSLFCCQIEG